jgi:hypothetical protein
VYTPLANKKKSIKETRKDKIEQAKKVVPIDS